MKPSRPLPRLSTGPPAPSRTCATTSAIPIARFPSRRRALAGAPLLAGPLGQGGHRRAVCDSIAPTRPLPFHKGTGAGPGRMGDPLVSRRPARTKDGRSPARDRYGAAFQPSLAISDLLRPTTASVRVDGRQIEI